MFDIIIALKRVSGTASLFIVAAFVVFYFLYRLVTYLRHDMVEFVLISH